MMEEFLQKIPVFFVDKNIYLIMAVLGSTVFVIQSVVSFFGISDMGTDADLDGIPDGGDAGFDIFKVFSFRTIVAFIAFFGLGGLVFDFPGYGRLIVAMICGSAMMLSVALIFYCLLKAQKDGMVTRADVIGCSGKVYLKIIGKEQPGKVIVDVENSTREINAVADKKIENGVLVEVVWHVSGNTYQVVEKELVP